MAHIWYMLTWQLLNLIQSDAMCAYLHGHEERYGKGQHITKHMSHSHMKQYTNVTHASNMHMLKWAPTMHFYIYFYQGQTDWNNITCNIVLNYKACL